MHLPATGVVAAEQFTGGFSKTINPAPNPNDADVFVTSKYTTFGANAGREVLDDGAGNNLEVLFPAPGLTLGMANPQKIGGLLLLANVHFLRNTYIPEGEAEIVESKPGKTAFMVCVQYTTDGINWITIDKTERFQTERVADKVWGEGPFTRTPTFSNSNDRDIWTFQDMPLRVWLDVGNFSVTNIRGFRIAGAVVNLQPTAGWPASFTFKGYYREANLSVIPFHNGILP